MSYARNFTLAYFKYLYYNQPYRLLNSLIYNQLIDYSLVWPDSTAHALILKWFISQAMKYNTVGADF